ncbi:MAG TPA: chemotaxis protein CheB [Burkholderiales bacterium]|nr:chemotaxis protein CheB [Burkholderiales bacterium]
MNRRHYELVVIAASAGGVQVLQHLLSGLPHEFPLPILVVLHRSTTMPNLLPRVLGRHTALKVKTANEGEAMTAGTLYLAPPHEHLVARSDQSLALTDGRKIRHVRSSANPLFASAAQVFGKGVIAEVLTGGDRDATDGVQTVKRHGGMVIAQDKASSELFGMHSAIETGCVDAILPLSQMAPELLRLSKLPAEDLIHNWR